MPGDQTRQTQDAAYEPPAVGPPAVGAPAPQAAEEAAATAEAFEAIESLPPGTVSRQVLILALPMLGEQFVNFLLAMVDTYLAGQISKEATAAVGTGGYMGWFVTLAFGMVSTGAAALTSRAFGGRDPRQATRVMHQAVVLALMLGPVITVAMIGLAPMFAAYLTRTDVAAGLFVHYLRIDALGFTLFSILIIGGACSRAAGDTRTPMMIMVAINIVNMVVSAALVFGWLGLPRLGVTGIAIGTVTARSLGGIAMLVVLIGGLRGMRLRWRGMRPDFSTVRRMLRIGLPAAGDMGMLWATHMLFVGIVSATATGDAATVNFAAHIIAMRLEAITYLPATAWMTAAGTVVGQYLGAARGPAAYRAGHVAALQGAALTTVVGICFFIFASGLYRLMSDEPAVWSVGVPAFRVMAFFQPILCAGIIYVGTLRLIGDTRWTMGIQIASGVGLRLPLAYLLGIVLGGGLFGAWCGMWVDNVAKLMLGFGRYVSRRWMSLRV